MMVIIFMNYKWKYNIKWIDRKKKYRNMVVV